MDYSRIIIYPFSSYCKQNVLRAFMYTDCIVRFGSSSFLTPLLGRRRFVMSAMSMSNPALPYEGE